MSVRKLAEHFACAKSQIASIHKSKESILELYESNLPSETMRSRKTSRTSEFVDVNEALHKWYLLAVSRNIYLVGPQLCEKSKEIAKHLEIPNYKTSNGWLDRWKKRYNVKRMNISGESESGNCRFVEGEDTSENIWNLDETACFWKALPDHGFGKRGSQCKGGKKVKQRVTIA